MSSKRHKRILAILLSLTVLSGCSDFNRFYENRKKAGELSATSSEVVAVMGSEEITRADLNEAFDKLPYKERKLYRSSPQKLSEYLDAYINQRVLYAEAEKRGIGQRTEIVEKTENFKKKLVSRTFGKEILDNISISDSDIEDYYVKHKEMFERINVSEIFVKVDPAKGVSVEDARKNAESIRERISAGEEFEKLASQFSDDISSKKRGGKVGYVSRDRYPGEIDDRIFSMKEGQISEPLEVENGFYIIKVDETAYPLPDRQVSRKIKSELINERLIEYINGLRNKWGVVVFKDRLKESVESE